MTRETVKDYFLQIEPLEGEEETISNRWKPEILNEMIDQIYNDLEARTCGHCKHIKEDSDDGTMFCTNENSLCYNQDIISPAYTVHADFGCNRWEKCQVAP